MQEDTSVKKLVEIEQTLADWKSEPVHQPDFEWREKIEWLVGEVKSLHFERDCLADYVEGLLGLGISVEEYVASRKI